MNSSQPDYKIERYDSNNKYVIYDGEKPIGLLNFTVLDDQVKNLFHTEIDSEYEGRGLGKLLVQKVLDDAHFDKIKIQPTCPFVRAYIEKHPQYWDLLR
jgi:predicted GNAT family acetyltransferase